MCRPKNQVAVSVSLLAFGYSIVIPLNVVNDYLGH